MAADPILTVEELQRMTPQERLELLKERSVTDLTTVDPAFLARATADVSRVLETRRPTNVRPA